MSRRPTAAPGATTAQRQAVTDAIERLNDAEKAPATLKGDRRTARAARDAACTSDVTTLGSLAAVGRP